MIEVLKSGLYTSVQDTGRFGYTGFGVPKSGAMDRYAADFANILLCNAQEAAVLEMIQIGPKLKFHCDALIAIVGLGADVYLDMVAVPLNKPCLVRKESVLEIKRIINGRLCYLAVFGGIQTTKILDSRSMYHGITPDFRVRKNDFLSVLDFPSVPKNRSSSMRFKREFYACNGLKVFPGPEYSLLSEKERDRLSEMTWTLTRESSRMAYLIKEKLENNLPEILTGPVLPGNHTAYA